MFTVFCCGSTSFILNGLIVRRLKLLPPAGAKRLTLPWFFPYFNCGFYGDFNYAFDILDGVLTNLFLSLSPAKSSSNSSCTGSDN